MEIRITPSDAGGAGTAGTTGAFTVDNLPPYSVQTITDPQTGNIEYQMWENGFQFGTLIQTPQGTIGFRGHPDQNDVNGWGTTVQENVYITGSGVDATGGAVTSAVAGTGGIQVSAGGNVPSSLGTAGTWSWASTITYDPTEQNVTLTGATTVDLNGPLSGDMNVGRDDSNYLYDYPLNGGGVGPTGDMKSVTFTYGPDSSVRENQWTPLPGLEGTSPQDASDDVATTIWGQINESDPIQTAIAKPTVQREIVSSDPTTKLIVACNWDSAQVGYQYDNIGVEQIVRPQNTDRHPFRISEHGKLDPARHNQPDRLGGPTDDKYPYAGAYGDGESLIVRQGNHQRNRRCRRRPDAADAFGNRDRHDVECDRAHGAAQRDVQRPSDGDGHQR